MKILTYIYGNGRYIKQQISSVRPLTQTTYLSTET